MGVHLSREEVSAPCPPSAVTTPSGDPTPVRFEKSTTEEGHPGKEPAPSRRKGRNWR